LLVAVAACAHRVPASMPPPEGASQRLELARSGHLLVTANLDGHPYVFVLDTGASITALSTATARELGLATSGSMSINDSINAPLGTVQSLAISGVVHTDVQVAIVDLPDALAVGARGVIGLDVLARDDVIVDLAGAEFGVYPAGTIASFGHDLVPLAYGAHGLILLDVVLDGTTTVPAMLDLGSPVSVLNSSAAVLMAAKGNIVPIVARTENTTLTPVDMLVSDRGTFARLGLAYRPAAVLGTDVFEGRLLAISYRDRVAFVSKSGRI
jgi:hypothetical protein